MGFKEPNMVCNLKYQQLRTTATIAAKNDNNRNHNNSSIINNNNGDQNNNSCIKNINNDNNRDHDNNSCNRKKNNNGDRNSNNKNINNRNHSNNINGNNDNSTLDKLNIIRNVKILFSIFCRFDAAKTCPEPWSFVDREAKVLKVQVCHLTQFALFWSFQAENGIIEFLKENNGMFI